ncbi:hypothetical protein K1719_018513 [Acacia pycnantha]|nr:hypothetical protein K1719_018513 [Acacia pycnantha]
MGVLGHLISPSLPTFGIEKIKHGGGFVKPVCHEILVPFGYLAFLLSSMLVGLTLLVDSKSLCITNCIASVTIGIGCSAATSPLAQVHEEQNDSKQKNKKSEPLSCLLDGEILEVVKGTCSPVENTVVLEIKGHLHVLWQGESTVTQYYKLNMFEPTRSRVKNFSPENKLGEQDNGEPLPSFLLEHVIRRRFLMACYHEISSLSCRSRSISWDEMEPLPWAQGVLNECCKQLKI